MDQTLAHWIRTYTKHFRVVILKPKSKVPALGVGWQDKASSDPEEALSQANAHPGCNIGLMLGETYEPELYYHQIDIDYRSKGKSGFRKLSRALGPTFKPLRSCLTPSAFTSNGYHISLLLPFSITGELTLYPGVTLRGRGLYQIVEPSTHPTGKEYVWVNLEPHTFKTTYSRFTQYLALTLRSKEKIIPQYQRGGVKYRAASTASQYLALQESKQRELDNYIRELIGQSKACVNARQGSLTAAPSSANASEAFELFPPPVSHPYKKLHGQQETQEEAQATAFSAVSAPVPTPTKSYINPDAAQKVVVTLVSHPYKKLHAAKPSTSTILNTLHKKWPIVQKGTRNGLSCSVAWHLVKNLELSYDEAKDLAIEWLTAYSHVFSTPLKSAIIEMCATIRYAIKARPRSGWSVWDKLQAHVAGLAPSYTHLCAQTDQETAFVDALLVQIAYHVFDKDTLTIEFTREQIRDLVQTLRKSLYGLDNNCSYARTYKKYVSQVAETYEVHGKTKHLSTRTAAKLELLVRVKTGKRVDGVGIPSTYELGSGFWAWLDVPTEEPDPTYDYGPDIAEYFGE